MNQRPVHSQSEVRARRINFFFRAVQFKEEQWKEEKEKASGGNFLKRADRIGVYALNETPEKAVSEDFRRWGLCSNCERRLLGRATTAKPADLICLGCLQSECK